jgi:cobalt-zinc-cadmium resistance protein CzcA
MTAALAALGLIPASISRGIGSETQKPLAVVIVAGTISACAITLVLLPVMVKLFARFTEHVAERVPPGILKVIPGAAARRAG